MADGIVARKVKGVTMVDLAGVFRGAPDAAHAEIDACWWPLARAALTGIERRAWVVQHLWNQCIVRTHEQGDGHVAAEEERPSRISPSTEGGTFGVLPAGGQVLEVLRQPYQRLPVQYCTGCTGTGAGTGTCTDAMRRPFQCARRPRVEESLALDHKTIRIC